MPLSQGKAIVQSQDLDIGQYETLRFSYPYDFRERGNVAAREDVLSYPWICSAGAIHATDRVQQSNSVTRQALDQCVKISAIIFYLILQTLFVLRNYQK